MRYFSLAIEKITGLIDWLNDKLTAYRLMLYFLLALLGWAVIGSFYHEVSYSWHEILISAGWLVAVCWTVNKLTARFLDVPANKESDLITALILALILTPPHNSHDFALLAAAGIAAMVTKYAISIYNSHIFNPAAAGAFVSGEVFQKFPSWWVGTKFMAPLLIIGGLLILRKTKRFTMVGLFLAIYILYLIYGTKAGGDVHTLWLEVVSTPVLFFAIVMLTEPLTSPTVSRKYLPYAAIVGILYSVTKLRLSPEEALMVGNLFTFLTGANRRYRLRFVRRIKEAEGIFSYVFTPPPKFSFRPGQYMEWTIAHNKTDSRGNRRYLTISSAPTESAMMFTIKHPPQASSFKQTLNELQPGETILGAHLAGDFILPKDTSKKLALLAGGVGVTPFRSMVKYLIDSGEQRDVVLLYSANSPDELSFTRLFDQAAQSGIQARYVTDGRIDEAKIQTLLPDYGQRTFYLSGPYPFVHGVQAALLRLGVSQRQMVTDFFPGYGG